MTSPTSAGNEFKRESGFTLLELLVVLGILSLILGLSIGSFRKSIPRRELARNQILDKLRRAQLFSVSENAPAGIILQAPSIEDAWPTVTAFGRRVVGIWHLEGTDLEGYPFSGRGVEIEEDASGKLGKAVHLSSEVASFLEFAESGSFESTAGLAVELFVKADDLRERKLFSKGDCFELLGLRDGSLRARVRVVRAADPKAPKEVEQVYHEVETDTPAIWAGSWVKIAATFDGLSLRLFADDSVVAELPMQDLTKLSAHLGSALRVGDPDRPFAGSVDEVKFGIFTAETSEPLEEMQVVGGRRIVRFAPGGGLDPLFHGGPEDLRLKTLTGADVWISIGVLGDIN